MNKAFNTALLWATRKGNRAIVKTLLNNNASIEVKNAEVIAVVVHNVGYKGRLIIGEGVCIRQKTCCGVLDRGSAVYGQSRYP